mmetsp:Transcript_11168/g.36890  ORF Transcript_11168/g.36890 Transcript_11168/m.36890 type:complete len:203 (-) Transcript_11168:1165-1773(-)
MVLASPAVRANQVAPARCGLTAAGSPAVDPTTRATRVPALHRALLALLLVIRVAETTTLALLVTAQSVSARFEGPFAVLAPGGVGVRRVCAPAARDGIRLAHRVSSYSRIRAPCAEKISVRPRRDIGERRRIPRVVAAGVHFGVYVTRPGVVVAQLVWVVRVARVVAVPPLDRCQPAHKPLAVVRRGFLAEALLVLLAQARK